MQNRIVALLLMALISLEAYSAATVGTPASRPTWAGQPSPFDLVLVCDVNGDGQIDTVDLSLIRAAIGSPTYPGDPRDANADGKINLADVRICSQRCTKAYCAT